MVQRVNAPLLIMDWNEEGALALAVTLYKLQFSRAVGRGERPSYTFNPIAILWPLGMS